MEPSKLSNPLDGTVIPCFAKLEPNVASSTCSSCKAPAILSRSIAPERLPRKLKSPVAWGGITSDKEAKRLRLTFREIRSRFIPAIPVGS